jgi:mono/diheme cytochrome c family protein
MTSKLSIPAVLLATGVLAGCGPQGGAPEVSFRAQLQPLLQKHCAECHQPGGAGNEKSGFAVDSHASVMQGTKYGPVVVPGSAVSSSLYRLVSGETDPSIRMPHGRDKLPDAEIALIQNWIDQGAKDN